MLPGSITESRDGKYLEIEKCSTHDNLKNAQRQGHQLLPLETIGKYGHQHLLAPSLLTPYPHSPEISQDFTRCQLIRCWHVSGPASVIPLLPSGWWSVICAVIWRTDSILSDYTALKKRLRGKRAVSRAKMRYLLKNCLEELWEQLKSIEWNYIFQVITRTDKAIFSKAKMRVKSIHFGEMMFRVCSSYGQGETLTKQS